MTRNLPTSLNTFFDALNSSNYSRLIGFDDIFGRAETLLNSVKTVGYPPCNIVKVNDNEYEIQLAVAGFTTDNLDIEVEDNVIKVTGKSFMGDEVSYIHRGIAMRDFVAPFMLGEYVEVSNASLRNGLLTITCTRRVPDSKKAKKVPVEG